MLIGDPYKFAVLVDKVDCWNGSVDDSNGYFALCIDGKIFPKYIINAVINTSIYDTLNVIENIPEDASVSSLSTEELFKLLYGRTFPEEFEQDNDYQFLLSPYALTDENCFVFAVRHNGKIIITGAELTYDIDNSRHSFQNVNIASIELSENEMYKITSQLKLLLCK